MGEQPQSGDGLVMPEAFPCKSENINVENIKSASSKLKSMGQVVDSRMDAIVGLWNGLPGVYVAPEAEQAYGLMAPAATASETIKTKFEKASSALDDFAGAIEPVKSELASLESEAAAFRSATLSRYGDKWRDHQEVVDRNNELLSRYARVVETLTTAAASCANTINGLLDGVELPKVEGVSADALMQSGEMMPWGAPVEKNRNCGESVVHGAGNFLQGTWDGAKAMVGIGADGSWSWGNFANTWLGTADFIGSTILLASPTLSETIKFFGNDDVDSWVDARHDVAATAWTGMIGFDYAAHKAGKDGWHKWAEDPVAAATESALNIGSNFIPGAGAAKGVIGGTKVGAAALKTVNMATRVADFAVPGGGWLIRGGVKVVDLGLEQIQKLRSKIPVDLTDAAAPTKSGPLTPSGHTPSGHGGASPHATSGGGGGVSRSSGPGPDFEAPANPGGPKLTLNPVDSPGKVSSCPGMDASGVREPALAGTGGSPSHGHSPEPGHTSAGGRGEGPSAHHGAGGAGYGGGSSHGGGSVSAHLGSNGGATAHTGGGGAGHGGGTSHGGSAGHHGGAPSRHGGAPGHAPEPEVGSRPRRSPDENNVPDDHAPRSGSRGGEPGSDVPDAPRKKPDADLADSPDRRPGGRTRPEGRGDDIDRPRTDTGDPAKPRTDTTPDNHPGRDKHSGPDEHSGRDGRPDVDEHSGRDRRPDVDENPGRGEHPGDGRGDGVDGADDHRHSDEGSGSGGDGSDHGTSGSGNDPMDDLPRYDEKGNPLYDDHGDPVEVDRGDGRKHYASDPEGTFRSQDDRLRHSDNGQFAEDPYAHRPKGIKYYARKILLGDHDWNNPALAERTRADTRIWDEARTKARTDRRAATQAINDIETLKTRDGKKLQLDTTDKSYTKLAKEVDDALSSLDPESQAKAERIMKDLRAATRSASGLRKVSEWAGDRAGHHLTLDHSPDAGGAGRKHLLGEPADTPDGAKPTGAGKGDRFSTEGDSRLVFGENKGGDSPGLGSRETAAGPRAQQGTAEYVMDLLSGKNQDPRLLETLTALEHSPEHAGFYQKLKTEGVEVVYEMVNVRTDGTVKVGQFDLGGKVILKLKDGQLIAEFIKKETP